MCRNAVLDSNVCIGNDVSITNMYGILEADRADTGGFMIQVCTCNFSSRCEILVTLITCYYMWCVVMHSEFFYLVV